MCSLFDLCRSRGWEFYYEGRLEEAIAEWRIAADLDPEDGYILTSIGQALFELGRQEEAFSEWWKAIHLEPEYDVPYIYLADALFGAGYTSKALTTIHTALRLCPASANLHIRLGHYLATQADGKSDKDGWKAAAVAFHKSLEINPADSFTLRSLASLQWKLGKKREAIETLKVAIIANRDDAEAHVQLWNYQSRAREFRGMIQTINLMGKLPESEALNRHYTEINNLWAQVCLVFWAGLGFVGVMAGGWIWYRRGARGTRHWECRATIG